jgi:hypothetical protein
VTEFVSNEGFDVIDRQLADFGSKNHRPCAGFASRDRIAPRLVEMRRIPFLGVE